MKKTVLGSILALAVSVALLAGATFAWFTDSIVNSGNTITAGKLEIEATAYDYNENGAGGYVITGVNGGNALNFETTGQALHTDGAAIIQETNWEPGASNAKLLKVENAGTLAAKVKLEFTTSGDLTDALWFDFIQVKDGNIAGTFTKRPMNKLAALAEDIELTIEEGVNVQFILVYGMYEDAGNDYQGKSFKVDVAIKATQAAVEEDGFGNTDYDTGATYPASNEQEVIEAINQAQDGDTVALTGEIMLENPITINKDVTIDGLGNGIVTNKAITVTANVTFNDVKLIAPTNNNKNATHVYAFDGCETLTFEGVTFSDPQWEAMQITSKDFVKLVVNNCTFTAANVDGAESSYGNTADQAIRFIHIQPRVSDNVVADITITNNKFENCNKVKDAVVGIYYIAEGSTLTVGNNEFEDCNPAQEDGTAGMFCFGWPAMDGVDYLDVWKGAEQTFTY